ncbi:MAG TPA: phytoene/squalene synthase family protein [Chthoniobacteraceae bacterium]|nr:phytoene/squalene synthase family protein [Chthoniobacteraceae bacterium]
MNAAELGGPLLKAVSRSFYLSIRILPRDLQAPIGLAYLLARASDTIADTADASETVRLRHLAAFEEMIRCGKAEGLAELQREIHPPDPGECDLIARLDFCLRWLATLDEFNRREIAGVMEKIIRGQTLDLQRFSKEDGVTALRTAAELEEYTYLVAGCVGEFWTRLCFHHLPRYADKEESELCDLGRSFGKGLQLVNILRDIPADRRAGRCYLPAEELAAANSTPRAPARDVFQRWHQRATELLDDGRRYIAALRPARLRIACFLPWCLGVETLRLLQKSSPLETDEKIKVPRSTVRAALLRAPLVALSNAPLRV